MRQACQPNNLAAEMLMMRYGLDVGRETPPHVSITRGWGQPVGSLLLPFLSSSAAGSRFGAPERRIHTPWARGPPPTNQRARC